MRPWVPHVLIGSLRSGAVLARVVSGDLLSEPSKNPPTIVAQSTAHVTRAPHMSYDDGQNMSRVYYAKDYLLEINPSNDALDFFRHILTMATAYLQV